MGRATSPPVTEMRQRFCVAARRGRDGEMVCGVVDGRDVGLADEGDPLAVGGPSGRTVCAEVGGDLREVRAFVFVVRGYDPNVRVKVAVGVGRAAVAGESEKMTIGRPGRLVVIVIA